MAALPSFCLHTYGHDGQHTTHGGSTGPCCSGGLQSLAQLQCSRLGWLVDDWLCEMGEQRGDECHCTGSGARRAPCHCTHPAPYKGFRCRQQCMQCRSHGMHGLHHLQACLYKGGRQEELASSHLPCSKKLYSRGPAQRKLVAECNVSQSAQRGAAPSGRVYGLPAGPPL